MIREIIVDKNYQTSKMFGEMKKGDIFKVPYAESRHRTLRREAARQNREARLTGELKSKIDLKFRVSETEYPGFTTIIRLK